MSGHQILMCLPSRHPTTFGKFQRSRKIFSVDTNVSLVGHGIKNNMFRLIESNTSFTILLIQEWLMRKENASEWNVSPVAMYLSIKNRISGIKNVMYIYNASFHTLRRCKVFAMDQLDY